MTPFVLCTSLALLAVGLLGCQASSAKILSSSLPIYATSADAQAVAGGECAPVPIEISSESELDLVSASCGSIVAQVRSPRTGKVGWVPASALPVICAGQAVAKEHPRTGSKVN